MRVRTANSLSRWMQAVGLVSLATLAWTVLVPTGVLWSAALAAGLLGSVVVAAVLVHPPAIPTLASAIATAAGPGPSAHRGGRPTEVR
jgi:hypothetical protein